MNWCNMLATMQPWRHKYALTHYDADPDNDAWMILVFNNGSFTNQEIEDWIGNFPLSVCSVQSFFYTSFVSGVVCLIMLL